MSTVPEVEEGWEKEFPRSKVVAALESGDRTTAVLYDVLLAHDAQEAAQFIRQVAYQVTLNWQGSKEDLDYVLTFLNRFSPAEEAVS